MQSSKSTMFVFCASVLTIVAASFSNSALYSIMLPMRKDLSLSLTNLLIIILSFHVIEAALFILAGRLGERFQFIKVYLTGVALSFTGLLLISISTSATLAIIGRITGGVGNALAVTSAVALIKITLPEQQQARAMSLWLGAATLAFALGPFVGGLCDLATWRIVYWITMVLNVLAAISVLLGAHTVPKLPSHKVSLDLAGNSLFAIFMVSVILYFSMATAWGMVSAIGIILIIIAPCALVLFIMYEKWIAKSPILIFSLVLKRNFLLAMALALVAGAAVFAAMYFYNLFTQNPSGLHYSAWLAGATLLPMNAAIFILSIIIPGLAFRYGLRKTFVLGSFLMSAGFLLFFWLYPPVTYQDLWWRLLIVGIGAGLTFPMVMPFGMSDVKMQQAGVASGWLNSGVMFGASLSIPLGQIFYLCQAWDKLNVSQSWHNIGHAAQNKLIASLTTIVINPQQVLAKYSASISHELSSLMHQAVLNGFNAAMLVLAIFSIVALALSLLIKKS